MTFAEDMVKKYIKENLAEFHNRIHVCQMLDLLPCLTEMDKQQIRASVDRHGNNESVWLFFDHLQRRRFWVQQLIDALHKNGFEDLAERIQRVYDANQARPPSKPSAPPAPRGDVSRPSAPPAPLGADVSQAAVPTREDSNNPPSDVHQRSPRNDLTPGRVSSPMSGDPPRPAFSNEAFPFRHEGDCSTPVQETKHPSSSNDMVVKPKNTGNARLSESATPVQEKSEARPGMSLKVDKKPGDRVTADVTFPRSPNQSLRWMRREELLITTPANSRSSAGPQQTVSPDPRTSDNHPEENYYSSSDSSLSTPSGQQEPQDRQSQDLHVPSTIPCKSPVQVSDQSKQETTPKHGKEEVTQPTRYNATGSSRTHRICDTNEDDYVPPKPGVLISGAIPKLGDMMLNSHTTNPAYSGGSERLRMSEHSDVNTLSEHSDVNTLSEYSDPLMMSEPSQNGLSEERCSGPANGDRSRTTARTHPAPPMNENHLDDDSITFLRGTIVQPPSYDLTAAADPDVPTSRFRGPVPDSAPINGARFYPKNSDDVHPNEKAKDAQPSPWGNAVWPAVGLVFAFGVLALLRWLKK